ncbi:MAG: DNA repair protein RecO [bacterium]
MNLYKTEVIVLRDYDLGEQDKIVVFYSRRYGKIKVVAKGARRIKSRFAAQVQPPSYDSVVIHRATRSGLDTLSECKINYPFIGIRKNLLRFAYSCYLAELIDKFLGEEQPNSHLFELLVKTLFYLERIPKENLSLLMRSFEMRLLKILGYGLYLSRCINCEKERGKIQFLFISIKLGGLLCGDCQEEDKDRLEVSKKTVLLMEYLLYSSLEKAVQQKFDRTIEIELEAMIKKYLSYQLSREMITSRFVCTSEKLELKHPIIWGGVSGRPY